MACRPTCCSTAMYCCRMGDIGAESDRSTGRLGDMAISPWYICTPTRLSAAALYGVVASAHLHWAGPCRGHAFMQAASGLCAQVHSLSGCATAPAGGWPAR